MGLFRVSHEMNGQQYFGVNIAIDLVLLRDFVKNGMVRDFKSI